MKSIEIYERLNERLKIREIYSILSPVQKDELFKLLRIEYINKMKCEPVKEFLLDLELLKVKNL